MTQVKSMVTVRGTVIGKEKPLICTPLIGKDRLSIISELEKIMSKNPDIIEWRADFFESLDNTEHVLRTIAEMRELAGETPILFTIRSHHEGGQPISLSEQDKVGLLAELCMKKVVDLIDYELSNDAPFVEQLRAVSRENGVAMVMSYHNFESTPPASSIVDKLLQMEKYGADIAKVAVMPKSKTDALVLLLATEQAQNELRIPLISISMGEFGALSRMVGYVFGSDITFAIGEQSSAPGQIPIEDLRAALQIVQKYI
ncbi:type I 3-dehydroquinate dehydratase [Ammoniphilus sp. YIM 78166]|uniref:type I 3-dehydroquinate dehydratase n=1 Tax=Ammoniphilus sp. YIM 78166 TaxID=1644106 RepID=UPI0010702680|nr:type I 3-dehydroquinate dehydratase [Ammoniphilus sp. YIM 78166]